LLVAPVLHCLALDAKKEGRGPAPEFSMPGPGSVCG
jgi:hypothetical protein